MKNGPFFRGVEPHYRGGGGGGGGGGERKSLAVLSFPPIPPTISWVRSNAILHSLGCVQSNMVLKLIISPTVVNVFLLINFDISFYVRYRSEEISP